MKITNKQGLPQPFVNILAQDSYDLKDPDIISVTSLIDSPRIRQLWLKHGEDVEVDAADRIHTLRGSSVHEVLERAGSEFITEFRMHYTVNSQKISGKLDMLELHPEDSGLPNVLWDYKDTSVWAAIYNPAGKPEWRRQTNVLTWLLRKYGVRVDQIKIFMLMKDWSRTDLMKASREGRFYPPRNSTVIDIPIWGDALVERYIEERIKAHSAVMPPCTPEERWHKDDKYALIASGAKRAFKVCDSMAEAIAVNQAQPKGKYGIVVRPGADTRCTDWCDVAKFCDYYKQTYGDGHADREIQNEAYAGDAC